MAKRQLRWQDMDHTDDPLLEYVSSHKGSMAQTRGPIREFLAKKQAEQAEKIHRQYRKSLGQLWEFLEAQGACPDCGPDMDDARVSTPASCLTCGQECIHDSYGPELMLRSIDVSG